MRHRQWLQVRYTKPKTFVQLTVLVAPGQYQSFAVAVDNAMVRRALARRGISVEVGFSLGGIWKKVKKAAKAIGVNKVVSIAKKALPLAARVLPPPASIYAGGAAIALKTAGKLASALKAKRRGDVRGQRRHLSQAVKLGRAYEKVTGPRERRAMQKRGIRLYKIMVNPV